MLHYEVYIFINAYHSQGWCKLKRPSNKSFHVFSFDDTEEKVVLRFEGEKGQGAIYEITLYKYLNPGNELPIDPSISFLCVAHPV